GPDSDELIARMAKRWDEEEQRLGAAIDLRVMAVVGARIPEIASQVQEVLGRIGGDATLDESLVFNLLQSLLWLRCTDSCPDCVETRPPYQDLARASRALLATLVVGEGHSVAYGV